MPRYFEDIEVGAVQRFGRYEVTREEVLDFAGKYDFQPFHLSDEAAAMTHFGRLAASGWHSTAMMMAMTVAHMQAEGEMQAASLGAVGIDELRWLKPVYPGDVLSCETEVLETIPSRSRPEMGIVKTRTTLLNQHGEPVMTLKPILMIRTRQGAEAE
jgi:acyl dehydratase